MQSYVRFVTELTALSLGWKTVLNLHLKFLHLVILNLEPFPHAFSRSTISLFDASISFS